MSPSTPSYVRLAEDRDEDTLMEMTRLVHDECGLRTADDAPLPFCEDKVRGTLRDAINPSDRADPSRLYIGVIENGDRLEGSVCLSICEPWYSNVRYVAEMWNVVLPPYRKSRNFDLLIAFSKQVALALKSPLLMGVMSTERQAAKMRLYERTFGVRPYGGYFLFNGEGVFTAKQERRQYLERNGAR